MNTRHLKSGFNAINQVSTSRSRFFSSYVTNKHLRFLQGSLFTHSKKQMDLEKELHVHEQQWTQWNSRKSNIAQELFEEERKWRQDIKNAEDFKKIASLAYVNEFASFTSSLNQAKKSISTLNSEDLINDALRPLEEQKLRIKKAEEQVILADQKINSIKEDYGRVQDLIVQLRQAKERQHEASVQFHQSKENVAKVTREVVKINRMINNFDSMKSYLENSSAWKVTSLSSQFLSHFGETLAMTLRHKYSQY